LKRYRSPGSQFRLETGHLKGFLKPGIGGKPFRQRDKLAVGVIAQVGELQASSCSVAGAARKISSSNSGTTSKAVFESPSLVAIRIASERRLPAYPAASG
jgi:hypothetical protein